jgi:hypothetical protein
VFLQESKELTSTRLAGAGPRDATRGGVNRPALPGEPPADGKISPLEINRGHVFLHYLLIEI